VCFERPATEIPSVSVFGPATGAIRSGQHRTTQQIEPQELPPCGSFFAPGAGRGSGGQARLPCAPACAAARLWLRPGQPGPRTRAPCKPTSATATSSTPSVTQSWPRIGLNAVTDHQIILKEKRTERQSKIRKARQETPPVAYLKYRETPRVAEQETPPVANIHLSRYTLSRTPSKKAEHSVEVVDREQPDRRNAKNGVASLHQGGVDAPLGAGQRAPPRARKAARP
jgi:hypothetical protein